MSEHAVENDPSLVQAARVAFDYYFAAIKPDSDYKRDHERTRLFEHAYTYKGKAVDREIVKASQSLSLYMFSTVAGSEGVLNLDSIREELAEFKPVYLHDIVATANYFANNGADVILSEHWNPERAASALPALEKYAPYLAAFVKRQP